MTIGGIRFFYRHGVVMRVYSRTLVPALTMALGAIIGWLIILKVMG